MSRRIPAIAALLAGNILLGVLGTAEVYASSPARAAAESPYHRLQGEHLAPVFHAIAPLPEATLDGDTPDAENGAVAVLARRVACFAWLESLELPLQIPPSLAPSQHLYCLYRALLI